MVSIVDGCLLSLSCWFESKVLVVLILDVFGFLYPTEVRMYSVITTMFTIVMRININSRVFISGTILCTEKVTKECFIFEDYNSADGDSGDEIGHYSGH